MPTEDIIVTSDTALDGSLVDSKISDDESSDKTNEESIKLVVSETEEESNSSASSVPTEEKNTAPLSSGPEQTNLITQASTCISFKDDQYVDGKVVSEKMYKLYFQDSTNLAVNYEKIKESITQNTEISILDSSYGDIRTPEDETFFAQVSYRYPNDFSSKTSDFSSYIEYRIVGDHSTPEFFDNCLHIGNR